MTNTTGAQAHGSETISIADRYIAVWSEPDAGLRRSAIAALWVDEGVEFVEGTQFRGHDELEARVAEAYNAFVGSGAYLVTAADDLAVHGDILTFTIQLTSNEAGAPGELAWAARVFLIVDDSGRIVEDYHLTVKPLAA